MTVDSGNALAQVEDTAVASGLHVEVWGTGERVVLVHGSLATGAEEWDAQRPLTAEGFRLTVFDRRGYGQSSFAPVSRDSATCLRRPRGARR